MGTSRSKTSIAVYGARTPQNAQGSAFAKYFFNAESQYRIENGDGGDSEAARTDDARQSPRSKKLLFAYLAQKGHKDKKRLTELERRKNDYDLGKCTFKPEITKTFVSKRTKDGEAEPSPIYERLLTEGKYKDQLKEETCKGI